MRLVVADTSPLRYLAQINEIELLPRLFENVFIPSIVRDELRTLPLRMRFETGLTRSPNGLR